MSMLSRIKIAVCELFHCNSLSRKARVVHVWPILYSPTDNNSNNKQTNKQAIYRDNNNNQLEQIII